MPKHGMAIDHVCLSPQGRVSMHNATTRLTSHERRLRRRMQSKSYVATTKWRAKLHEVEIIQHDSSWCHVVDGNVVARFDDVSAAIAAL